MSKPARVRDPSLPPISTSIARYKDDEASRDVVAIITGDIRKTWEGANQTDKKELENYVRNILKPLGIKAWNTESGQYFATEKEEATLEYGATVNLLKDVDPTSEVVVRFGMGKTLTQWATLDSCSVQVGLGMAGSDVADRLVKEIQEQFLCESFSVTRTTASEAGKCTYKVGSKTYNVTDDITYGDTFDKFYQVASDTQKPVIALKSGCLILLEKSKELKSLVVSVAPSSSKIIGFGALISNIAPPAKRKETNHHIDRFVDNAERLKTGCTAWLDTLVALCLYKPEKHGVEWNKLKRELQISFVKDTKTANSSVTSGVAQTLLHESQSIRILNCGSGGTRHQVYKKGGGAAGVIRVVSEDKDNLNSFSSLNVPGTMFQGKTFKKDFKKLLGPGDLELSADVLEEVKTEYLNKLAVVSNVLESSLTVNAVQSSDGSGQVTFTSSISVPALRDSIAAYKDDEPTRDVVAIITGDLRKAWEQSDTEDQKKFESVVKSVFEPLGVSPWEEKSPVILKMIIVITMIITLIKAPLISLSKDYLVYRLTVTSIPTRLEVTLQKRRQSSFLSCLGMSLKSPTSLLPVLGMSLRSPTPVKTVRMIMMIPSAYSCLSPSLLSATLISICNPMKIATP